MHCPFCEESDTKVVDSRLVGDGQEQQVRRRRECVNCHGRFTTYESMELSLPRLLKKDGNYVQFQEEKLRLGILKAVEKRSVPMEVIDNLTTTIVRKLRAYGEREISTQVIGDWVMEELRQIDGVAYVRFASVYRQFEDVQAFQEVVAKLDNQPIN